MKLKLGKILTLSIKTAAFGCCLALCASTASAQEITAIDFNGDLIGKVISDGKVVSFENQLIGNITADSLIVDFEGNLIGGVVPKGIAIGNDNRLLGKVNNDGTVRLSTGKIVGKVLPNGLVVDDRFSVLGAVLFPGLIYSDKGETVGRLTGDGLYSNLQGQTIGFISPDGYAYRKVGNDYVLDGRLISAKMIIDASGKFIGSIAPGGKVTDFEGKPLGLIKANGFAYDGQDKIIGRVVKSGYAFDNNGKYIGFVTYNGEVVNKNKTVGHLQIDGTIADDKGKVIGFMADIASTVTDATGKYIGRIMPEGKIAQVRNFVGEIGPRHIVFGTDGKEIGRLLVSGPVFDYRGALRGHALKNGQVILLEGTPIGSIYGSRASDYNGRNIGKTFESRLVVNSLNQVLGVNGISSAFINGEEKKYLSPFGYVFNADGGIDGNLLPLGDIYNQNGEPIASIYPNGEMVNNNAVIDGRLTQYGYSINDQNLILGKNIDVAYAVDYQGNSLGTLADGNMLLDKNLRNIAKILPDGEVVSDVSNPAAMMPVIGKALNRSLAVTFQGRFYGYIDDSGTVRDLGSSIVGKTGAGDVVFDNNGHPVAEAVSYTPVIDDQCEFVGIVTAQGEVRNYREVSMGHVLPNGQVYSVNNAIIGHAFNSGSVVDFSGNVIGTVASTGKVINYANQNMGCVNRRGLVLDNKKAVIGKLVEIAPVMNFNNVIIGRSTMDGTVINGQNTVIGYIRPDDSVSSKTGLPTGILFKYRYAFNNNNKLIGTVNDRAEVIDNRGRKVGMVDFDGNVIIGSSKSGYALYDMYIYDNDNYVMGYISADGQVLSLSNRNLGALTKGFLVDNSGKAIGRGNRDFQIRDNLNAILGELQLDGRVLNSNNELVGTLGASGDIIAPGGEVIARARPLQFYEAVRRQPIYDKDGNIIGYVTTEMQAVDSKGNVIGRIGRADPSRKGRIARDADGNIIGYADENGNVIDANGNIIGQVTADGTVIDAKSITGKAGESRKLVYDENGKVIGYVDEKGNVRDMNNRIIGEVVAGGEIVDANGNVIGMLNKDGSAISPNGEVFGNLKLNWYEKPQPSQPEDLPEIGARTVTDVGQFKRSLNIALTPDGEYLGDILENGNVVDKSGKVIGKLLPDGLVVDSEGSLIGIEEAAKKSDTGEMFVPAGTFGQGGAYGIGTGGGNLGPGGGFGPGERYDPQRAAALQAAQNERRKGMYVGKLSTNVRREAFDGYQKDWADQGIDKTVSSWRVDMSLMILADKPIPAVIARSIDTEHPVPVTAFVERNVYAEDGRNIVIPAGSRLIGELSGGGAGPETSSESARVVIVWERLIRPDGVLFTFQGETGDASGRGGALGYYDQQLGKKYGLPLITSLLTSATTYMMATDEEPNAMETETSRQQAANDARESFVDQMNQIFNMIMTDKTNIKALTYIPAGTRIIVYPKIDLWLRTAELDADASTNMKKKDVLIDDKEAQDRIATQAAERRIKQAGGTGGSVSSQVIYESEQSTAQPVLLDDNSSKSKRTSGSAVGATPPPPPPSSGSSSSTSSSSSSSGSSSGVPQLF